MGEIATPGFHPDGGQQAVPTEKEHDCRGNADSQPYRVDDIRF